jgi:MFS family permease
MAQSAPLASNDLLSAQMLTVACMIVFFFASPAASSAYLTVSEIFPPEIRAIAIAFFYAIGTGVGGVAGPLLGSPISTGSHADVTVGHLLGAVLMLVGAIVEAIWGVAAERKSLESVARPLSFVEE